MKQRLLITGANGFVGRHLIDRLLGEYEIVGIAGRDKDLFAKASVDWHQGDIADQRFVSSVVKKLHPDAIIHLAAKTQAWFSDVRNLYDVNVLGTLNVYESVVSLRKSSTYNPRIVYVSSSEIYGKTPLPEAIDENAPMFPVNPYGASKTSADRVSYAYSQSQKLNVIIARPFTHTGPGQTEGFFVPDMVSQIVKAENDTSQNKIFTGNLTATRDYLDVRDVVRAYEALLDADIAPGEAFNICSGQGIKISVLLDKLLALTDKKLLVEKDPERLRPSDVPIFVGDSTKLQKYTGWKPEIPLDTTLHDVLANWRNKK